MQPREAGKGKGRAKAAGAVAGVVAFSLALLVSEPPGPGLAPDSMSYIGSAVSLLRTGTLRVPVATWTSADTTAPLTHFPPGFPLAIALPAALGMPPLQAARLVVAVSAFVTAAILTWLVADVVGVGAGVIVALALLASPVTAGVHMWALSEPLYLALLAASLALMTRAPARPIAYGLTAAAAMMVRYAGASLGLAALMWAIAPTGAPLATRLRRGAAALMPALLLGGVWAVRATRAAEFEGIRTFAVYDAPLGAAMREAAATLAAWLAPGVQPETVRNGLALLAGFVVTVVVAQGVARASAPLRDDSPAERRIFAAAGMAPRLLAATGLCAAAYAAFVVAARLVADPRIPFDDRMLAPLVVLLTVGGVTAAALWWREGRWPARAVALACAGTWLAGSALVTRDAAAYALEVGNDFSGVRWHNSEVLEWVRTQGTDRTLFTNWPVAVYFHAQRMAHRPPPTSDSAVARQFRETLLRRHGALVVFDEENVEAPAPDSLAERAKLHLLEDLSDGRVYVAP